jgi:KipI family sensor histidine kinase inhibitor
LPATTAHRVVPAGDCALAVVAPAAAADPGAWARAAAASLRAAALPGVEEVVGTLASVFVVYEPQVAGYDELAAAVRSRLAGLDPGEEPPARTFVLPVCFAPACAPDLPQVAEHAGLSLDETVALLAEPVYTVELVGFLPGFAYLGGLPERLRLPRLATPRPRVAAGSVGVAGAQAGVYPLESPGGWRIVGRTPARPYDPRRPEPVVWRAGDRVRFEPVDEAAFAELAARAEAGEVVAWESSC